ASVSTAISTLSLHDALPISVPVQLLAVPAREGHHDRADPALDRRDVGSEVDAAQLLLGDLRVALVLAALGAAVGHEVLRAREDRSEEHTSELQSRENLVCCL